MHHALTGVLEPIFERSFIHDSLRLPQGQGHPRRRPLNVLKLYILSALLGS